MPGSSKVFVTGDDGTLSQLWWSGQAWQWANHGKPPNGRADTVPATISEGKLHINCSTSATDTTAGKHLCELYWNGSSWVWYDHGQPAGVALVGDATADSIGQKSYMRGIDNQYYERSWNPTANSWQWLNHGAPPVPGYMPSLHVLVHVQGLGDMATSEGKWAGTMGNSLQMEGFAVAFKSEVPGLGLEYMAHLAGIGDTPFVAAGQFIGTRGEFRQLEGFAARLIEPNASRYDLLYQCHMASLGDSAVVGGSQFCGTRGQSRRVEAIRIWIIAK